MSKIKRRFLHLNSFLLVILMTFSTATLVSGCGGGSSSKSKTASVYYTSDLMTSSQEISGDEKAIATRICYAYQSKGVNFKTPTYINKSFTFSSITTDCSSKKSSKDIVTKLSLVEGILVFNPLDQSNTTKYYDKVQTNEVGFLSSLCTKIQNNQAVSNTTTSGGMTIQVYFYKEGTDNYRINYFSPNEKSIMTLRSSDVIKVRTQFNMSTGKILGFDEAMTKYQTCPNDSTKFSEFVQTFVKME